MNWLIFGGMVYLVCGVLAFGLIKGGFLKIEKRFESSVGGMYSWVYEKTCWWMGILGPLGLVVALITPYFNPEEGKTYSMCFKMPKKYLEEK